MKKYIISFFSLLIISFFSYNMCVASTLLAESEVGPGAGGVGISPSKIKDRVPDDVGTGAGGVGISEHTSDVLTNPKNSSDAEKDSDAKELETPTIQDQNQVQTQNQEKEQETGNLDQEEQSVGKELVTTLLLLVSIVLFFVAIYKLILKKLFF